MMLRLALVWSCALGACATSSRSTVMSTPRSDTSSDRYEIDGKAVSKADFEAFIATLGEQTNYKCRLGEREGYDSYEAPAPSGQRYRVESSTRNGHTANTATAIAAPFARSAEPHDASPHEPAHS